MRDVALRTVMAIQPAKSLLSHVRNRHHGNRNPQPRELILFVHSFQEKHRLSLSENSVMNQAASKSIGRDGLLGKTMAALSIR